MIAMSEKKRGRPVKRVRKGYTLAVYIDPVIGEAFDRFLAAHKPRTDKTAATELALEKLLTEYGFWPPPAKPDAEEDA